MKSIKKYIEKNYHLSNYQIAQLTFLAKTLGSELSKLLIMGILFHNRLTLYIFALIVMLCLRCSTGGLHFYTYTGCLIASILYLGLALFSLPYIKLNRWVQILLLLGCIIACYIIGPITSKYRPVSSIEHNNHCRNIACFFMFIYTLILYIIPVNTYLTVGFWIIILHSLQLLVAKIQKKGDSIK